MPDHSHAEPLSDPVDGSESCYTLALRIQSLEGRLNDLADYHRAATATRDNIFREISKTSAILERDYQRRLDRDNKTHMETFERGRSRRAAAMELWTSFKGPITQAVTTILLAVAAYYALRFDPQRKVVIRKMHATVAPDTAE